MDFPKTCSTNVLRVDNVLSYKYAIYSISVSPVSALVRLRQANVLCSSHASQLWTFNDANNTAATIVELEEQEQGTLQDKEFAPDASERLIDAVKAGLTLQLASAKGIFRLGVDNWVNTSEHSTCPGESIVLRVSVKYIQPGSLQILINVLQPHVSRLSNILPDSNSPLLLAPSGLHAVVQKAAGSDAQTPSLVEQRWRVALKESLQDQGIEVDIQASWISVQLESDSSVMFSWPANLCFVSHVAAAETTSIPDPDMLDPLAFAEYWAETAADRQQSILLEQQARTLPATSATLTTDDMDLVSSPPFFNRPDLVTAGGMYPTPPDGMHLVPANQVLVQPDSSLPSLQDVATDTSELFRLQSHDVEDNLDVRDHGDSIVSSMRDNLQHSAQDDLFGGAVNDFGGGEVGDNDFDFFDDQPSGLVGHTQLRSIDEELPHLTTASQETKSPENDIEMLDAASTPFPEQETPALVAEEVSAATAPLLTAPVDAAPKYKPLSPFEIRERLLPPPIPASQTTQAMPETRRGSFAPIKFNPEHSGGTALRSLLRRDASSMSQAERVITPAATPFNDTYGSPTKPGASTSSSPIKPEANNEWSDSDDESSDASSPQQCAQLPQLPWHDRKRRRLTMDDDAIRASWAIPVASTADHAFQDIPALLDLTLTSCEFTSATRSRQTRAKKLRPFFTPIRPLDILTIAQLLAEQAITCTSNLLDELDSPYDSTDTSFAQSAARPITDTVQHLLVGIKEVDLISVALQRDIQRPEPAKGQPRPPPRLDTTPTQELYPLSAPYLCFQRGDTAMQMLPPAIHFWEALSLSPANGAKDIQPYYIAPNNSGLLDRLKSFNDDFVATYESCKLGTIREAANVHTIWSGEADGRDEAKLYLGYLQLCKALITMLIEEAYKDPNETSVVVLIDPYNNTNLSFKQLLLALFWKLCSTYREKIVRRRIAKEITVQILPVGLVYAPHRLSFLTSHQMALLAREIYDRCPPGETYKQTSPLPIAACSSLVLANTLPKRVGFQLTANTPTDLLHEPSELHVAYAKSSDDMWISVVWMDSTGSGQRSEAFCLRGTSIAKTFTEIWTRTVDIVVKRPVSWRVSIAAQHDLTEIETQCWKELLVPPKQKRGGPIHVSLVAVRLNPALRVKAPTDRDGTNAVTTAGIITPVGTPQASGFTVSPDASGMAAPPTPAPTESSAEDGDAHFVDLPDETWGILFDPKYDLVQHANIQTSALAHGALIKYGDKESSADLPILGVSILFTLRLRAGTAAGEDATSKQAEVIMKELLLAYRGLALLAKARGLQRQGREGVPLHVVAAVDAADALAGLLE